MKKTEEEFIKKRQEMYTKLATGVHNIVRRYEKQHRMSLCEIAGILETVKFAHASMVGGECPLSSKKIVKINDLSELENLIGQHRCKHEKSPGVS